MDETGLPDPPLSDPRLPPVARLTSASGLSLAYRHHAGAGPLVVFLPGYMSDMAGGKACAVMADAVARGRSCLLLDYSGCGLSEGDFADGTLSRWRDEVIALIDHVNAGHTQRPVVLVGSSMGGWLMLLVAGAMVARGGTGAVQALVGIAAAPGFTDWGYSDEQRTTLERGETWFEDNAYGPDPTPYHPAFFRDAQTQPSLTGGIALACPVRLLHGQRDPDVPWHLSHELAQALASNDVRIHLIKDGDHRLSRDNDVALLLDTIREVTA